MATGPVRITAHIFYSTRTRRDYARRHGRRLNLGYVAVVALLLTAGIALRIALGA